MILLESLKDIHSNVFSPIYEIKLPMDMNNFDIVETKIVGSFIPVANTLLLFVWQLKARLSSESGITAREGPTNLDHKFDSLSKRKTE